MKITTLPLNDANFVGILAGLTHGILRDANQFTRAQAPAKAAHKSILERLDTWLWRQEVKSREAYLAESADIVELEQRQRWLERGRN